MCNPAQILPVELVCNSGRYDLFRILQHSSSEASVFVTQLGGKTVLYEISTNLAQRVTELPSLPTSPTANRRNIQKVDRLRTWGEKPDGSFNLSPVDALAGRLKAHRF